MTKVSRKEGTQHDCQLILNLLQIKKHIKILTWTNVLWLVVAKCRWLQNVNG